MQMKDSKPAIVGVGAFMAASLGVTLSASIDEDADNLFVAESLDDIDVLSAEEEEAKCGEGQCGDDDDEDGDDEGECGEGECGEGECGEEEGDDEDDDEDEEEEEEESTEE